MVTVDGRQACKVVMQMCGTDNPNHRVVCGQPREAHETRISNAVHATFTYNGGKS